MQEYWDDKLTPQADMLQTATAVADEGNHATTLASEYDCHRHCALIEKTAATHTDCGGWKHELCSYFSSIPADVSKDTDIIEWWSVSCPAMSWVPHCSSLQTNSNAYPMLSRIALDVCAIPVTSVPCEHLFSAGGEIATDHHSHLGSDIFEQLQVLRYAWCNEVVDEVGLNSRCVKEIHIGDFQELLEQDKALVGLPK